MRTEILSRLPKLAAPPWLAAITGAPVKPFPVKEMLVDSLYYPACGLNGTPAKFLSGHVLSFIYADYNIRKEQYLTNLNGREEDSGFKGYSPVLQQEVFRDEIVPAGWRPPLLPADATAQEKLVERERTCEPFGHWSVWQRDPGLDDSHGAERFSFFYMSGEISAIYQGLYNRLGIAPLVLSIIQPGGGNDNGIGWEKADAENSFFHQVVAANSAGLPRFLVYGGLGGPAYYEKPCWHEWEHGQRLTQLPERSAGLWERA